MNREHTQLAQRLRLCRWRFSSLRCLCLRIFLRRFLITLPTEYLVALSFVWRAQINTELPGQSQATSRAETLRSRAHPTRPPIVSPRKRFQHTQWVMRQPAHRYELRKCAEHLPTSG